jgi:type I restriction enzyme S subunit
MNAERLLALYERVADAPDAIPQLRRFVLDLAVRGKLVEQDSAEDAADNLLHEIVQAKKKLGIKHSVNPLRNREEPFDLPLGWRWSRIGEVCTKTGSGSTPRGGKEVYKSSGIPFLRSQNIHNDGLRLDDVVYIDPETHERMSGTCVEPGDLLLNITGGSMGRCARVPADFESANISQHVAIIRPAVQGLDAFMHRLILSPYFQAFIFDEQTGAGRGGLPKNRMDQIIVAFPPLAEQRRIVAKVDELMALLDGLETAAREREATRDRLAAATLARLTAPDTADNSASNARFALQTLPALTTRPDQIKALRQTILNLAVRGKLVEQDPNDEPGVRLLERLAEERAFLAKGAKLRAKRPITAVDSAAEEILPASWAVEAIGNLVNPAATISYGVLVPGPDVDDGVPFVRAQDLSLSGHAPRPNKTIAPEVEAAYARTRLKGGEILLCVVGSIGKIGIAPASWAGANVARAVARIAPLPSISTGYLLVALQSDLVQDYFIAATRTLAQPTLNVSLIEVLPIPIPPLAEQHRIVAKVEALMAVCDQLEAALAEANTTRTHLLEALLHEALAPEAAGAMELA